MAAPDPAIYRTILASMADGVLTLDMHGRVITLNAAAAAILGLTAEDTVGRSFAEVFFADEAFEQLSELVLKAIYEAEATHSEEVALPRPDGPRHLQVSTTYMREGEGGRNLGVIVVLSDLSERYQRKKMKRLIGQYIDPRIVGLMLDRPAGPRGEERRVMTVSFCDMTGFTALTERLDPDALLAVLNDYLAAMSQAVGRASGITDKYIGDSVMAFWGPPFNRDEDQAALACEAALEQVARLADLRTLVAPRLGNVDPRRIDIRIGIATGPIVAGDIGPAHARNFTVIGDSVNVAARLEQANKAIGTRILVGEEARRRAGDRFAFREIATLRLRGRDLPERVFELMATAADMTPEQARLREHYETALAAYRARDWPAARTALDLCQAVAPEDAPSRMLGTKVARGVASESDERWDGIWSGDA